MSRTTAENLVGRVFGELVVVSRADNYEKFSKTHNRVLKYARWFCKCSCGNSSVAYASDLKKGKQYSCGCVKDFKTSCRAKTHGMSYKRPYFLWRGILKRTCKLKSPGKFKNYYLNSISVCDRWNPDKGGSFENFWEDMKEGYSDDLTLDRIDNEKGYEAANCRWTTRSVQSFNKSLNKTKVGRVGVWFEKKINKWRARINYNKKVEYLGCFDTFKEACEARKNAELKYYGFCLKDNDFTKEIRDER